MSLPVAARCDSSLLASISSQISGRCSCNLYRRAAPRTQPQRSPRLRPHATWDPEGLLPASGYGGHFARRGNKTADPATADLERSQGLETWDPIRPIPEAFAASGGMPPVNGPDFNAEEYSQMLAERFMAVDLAHPGLRILSLDPPVFSVEGVLTAAECEEIIALSSATGGMQASKVGAGNVQSSINKLTSHRTSTSLLLDPPLLSKHAKLAGCIANLQAIARRLLAKGVWGPAGRPPAPSAYCFESPQVARYEGGEHFLEHEDGFPSPMATSNGFQRAATFLVYLNNVPQGGATRFQHLGLAVQPSAGLAVLFFPGYSDGRPDPRTLHSAEDAVDTKWVTQQWVAQGVPSRGAAMAGAAAPKVADSQTLAAFSSMLVSGPAGSMGGAGGMRARAAASLKLGGAAPAAWLPQLASAGGKSEAEILEAKEIATKLWKKEKKVADKRAAKKKSSSGGRGFGS